MKTLILALALVAGGCSLIIDVPPIELQVPESDAGLDGGRDYKIVIDMPETE